MELRQVSALLEIIRDGSLILMLNSWSQLRALSFRHLASSRIGSLFASLEPEHGRESRI